MLGQPVEARLDEAPSQVLALTMEMRRGVAHRRGETYRLR
jgi:hypothetical protein